MPPALAAHGRLPEWPKGAVCKTVGSAYVGSNPTPATTCENCPRPLVMRSGVVLVIVRLMQADAARSGRMPQVAGYTWDGSRRSGCRNEHDLPAAMCSHGTSEPRLASAVTIARVHPPARPCKTTAATTTESTGKDVLTRLCIPRCLQDASGVAGGGSARLPMAVAADMPSVLLEPCEVTRHAEPRLCGCWRCRHRR